MNPYIVFRGKRIFTTMNYGEISGGDIAYDPDLIRNKWFTINSKGTECDLSDDEVEPWMKTYILLME